VVKNGSPRFTTWKANNLKTQKGCVGSVSKPAWVAACHSLHNKTIKITTGLGTHVLEGKGDTISKKKKQKNTCLSKPCDFTKGISNPPPRFNDKM
jgi:hypothetical protein